MVFCYGGRSRLEAQKLGGFRYGGRHIKVSPSAGLFAPLHLRLGHQLKVNVEMGSVEVGAEKRMNKGTILREEDEIKEI